LSFWTIFTFPGRVIAWFGYMFPKRGEVWASARRVDNPAIHLLFSLLFYAGAGYVGFALITADRSPAAAASPLANAGYEAADGRPLEAVPAAEPAANALSANNLAPIGEGVPFEDGPAPGATQPSGEEPLLKDAAQPDPSPVKPERSRAFVDVQGLRASTTSALRTELLRLLDSGPAERHGVWRMEGVEGELMVTPWRRTDDGVCRLYSFTARSADDAAASGYQEACRTGQGPWAFD
jgi:hypothetical protein